MNFQEEHYLLFPKFEGGIHQMEIKISNQHGFSFTDGFSIKAAQADSKGLEGREWVAIIHGEDVFSNFPEL